MDSTNPLPQVFESENAVRLINALFDALGNAGIFGRNAETCEDLTWGWLGARLYSDLYVNGTLTVAPSTTSYVTKRKDDSSDPTASTSATNWNNTGDYFRIAKLISGPTAITSYEDHRLGWLLGIGGGDGGTGSGGLPGDASRDTITALSTSGTVNIDLSLGDYFTLALSGNVTSLTFSNMPPSGDARSIAISITQDSTSRTLTFPSAFKWSGAAPAISTTAGARDLLALTIWSSTVIDATLSKARA